MHLVQILLPLYDNSGAAFPASHFRAVAAELTSAFGGLTAYTRAPAEGLWKEDGTGTKHDEIVVYEVMTDDLDESWWKDFRRRLERRFAQDSLVVRTQETRLL
jgi:hypothetical protein